jgi:hypothetical protein
MIDEIALADPAREAAPTPAEGARMDTGLRRLMAAETRAGAAGDAASRRGDARAGAAGGAAGRRGDARVGAAGARPRRRGARRPVWVLAPVALATAALTLGVALPGGKTPAVLAPAPASAATVLADLQGKVAGTPADRGRYAYLKQLSYTSHMGSGYVAVIPHEYEQWVADDGSGFLKHVVHDDRATFPTPEDEAAYERRPRPPLDPSAHATDNVEVLGMRMDEVRALPTDPARLRAVLERRDNVVVTAYAGALLSFAGTPQDVKVALFGVLKGLPGAKLVPRATDPLNRTGVGIEFDDEAWRTLFLFDPATGALLGTKSLGKKEVPGRTIEDWNLTVESGRTDTAPATAR